MDRTKGQGPVGPWPDRFLGQSRAEHDLALYQHGFALMAQGAYHPAHDAWEDLWLRNRSDARAFLQGLIQATACCHHAEQGRWAPALALLGRVRDAWRPYPNPCLGADWQAFLDLLGRAGQAWAQGQAHPLPSWTFQAPSLEAFAPHAGCQQQPLPGHAYAWDATLPSVKPEA